MTEGYEVKIIRSKRKTMSLEITKECEILIRAPYRLPQSEIRRFVEEKEEWIEKHLRMMQERIREREENPPQMLTELEIRKLADAALQVFPEQVAIYARQMGVTYGRITIRNQKTRWGSCSAKGNLNFNCLLMLAPPEIRDYVIVHELAHRKEMNHSTRFWSEVEKILPDYRERREWLKTHGQEIMRRQK